MSNHSFTCLRPLVEAYISVRDEALLEGFAELPDSALQQLLRRLLLGRLGPNQLPRDQILLSSDEMWVRQAAQLHAARRCVVYAPAPWCMRQRVMHHTRITHAVVHGKPDTH
jgi:hypothetical protein